MLISLGHRRSGYEITYALLTEPPIIFESSEVEATSRKTRPGLLTPLDKFRGGLGYLSVSDLTAQFWCEQQMEYNFLAPEPKPETVQMQLGKDIHMARGKLVNKCNFLKFLWCI